LVLGGEFGAAAAGWFGGWYPHFRQGRERSSLGAPLQREMEHGSRPGSTRIDFLPLLHRFEQISESPDRFGGSEKQNTFWLECVMKSRHEFLLQTRFQIDEQVPAAN